jgi:hypothetical protein
LIISKPKGLTFYSVAEAGHGKKTREDEGFVDNINQETTKKFDYGAFYFTPDGDFRHFYAGADCMKEFVTILKESDPHYSLMRVMEFYKGNEIKRWGSALIEEDKTE